MIDRSVLRKGENKTLSVLNSRREGDDGGMKNLSIAPLRKRKLAGGIYARPANIETKLLEIQTLSTEDLIERCTVEDRGDSAYLPSECLLYLVRANRLNQPDAYFEALYKALAGRVLRALPPEENTDLTDSNIRDEVFHRFIELLSRDRLEYVENLDFFEIRFESALASLRTDVQRKAYREEKRSTSLEIDHETGEFSEEVERAAGSFDPFDSGKIDAADYRSRLDKAIDSLPVLQKAIVEMIRKGIPIDSKEAGTVTIAKTLRKAEKTIRIHRDKAYASLRTALTEGDLP